MLWLIVLYSLMHARKLMTQQLKISITPLKEERAIFCVIVLHFSMSLNLMPEKLEDIKSVWTLENNLKYGKTLKVLINNY